MTVSVDALLDRFRRMDREAKMAALLQYARKLEPVPPRLLETNGAGAAVPECQTPVEIYSEKRDGRMYFYALVNARQSPTVAAFLSLLFSVTNGHPPEATLGIPATFVRDVMDGIGLAAREVGLTAMLGRVRRDAECTARHGARSAPRGARSAPPRHRGATSGREENCEFTTEGAAGADVTNAEARGPLLRVLPVLGNVDS